MNTQGASRTAVRGGVAAAAGLLFGIGLALGGMTRPNKVIAFLDVTGAWDPSLAFVMLGAISVHVLALRVLRARAAPWFAAAFSPPGGGRIDARLLVGAATFGAGWGLAGYCPGPALAALVSGNRGTLVFVVAMLNGMWLVQRLDRARPRDGANAAAAHS